MNAHVPWLVLDLAGALLSVATWFGAGVTLALRRTRLALAILLVAVSVALVRLVTMAMLAGPAWWFVREEVLVGLPVLGVATAGPALLAARRLLAARQGRGRGSSPGAGVRKVPGDAGALA